MKYKNGDRVYIVANNVKVQALEVMKVQGDFYTLRKLETLGAVRLREIGFSRRGKRRRMHCVKLMQETIILEEEAVAGIRIVYKEEMTLLSCIDCYYSDL